MVHCTTVTHKLYWKEQQSGADVLLRIRWKSEPHLFKSYFVYSVNEETLPIQAYFIL